MRRSLSLALTLCLVKAISAAPSSVDFLDGLLGARATNVSEVNRRPDANHPFVAPKLTDQRGNCPGLNLLANHGYIPRNGIATVTQVVNASMEVFNMGPVLATFLSTITVAFGGNLQTDTFSIGGEDLRTYSLTGVNSRFNGKQYGSDAHGRIEGDMSPFREDFYLGDGDNHSGHGKRFRRFVELGKANGGSFSSTVVKQLYAANAKDSVKNNPKVIREGWTFPVSLAAYTLLSNLYGNGTVISNYGGTYNYETVSALNGFELNSQGKFCYKPERIPPNWYRSAEPFDFAVNGGFAAIFETYGEYPFLNNTVGALFGDINNAGTAGCFIFQSIISSVPPSLHGASLDRDRVLPLSAGFNCNITMPKAEDSLLPEASYPPFYNDKLQESGLGGRQKYGVCE